MLVRVRPRRMRRRVIIGITWSCPRCGRPFTTQQEMHLHYLSCGS